MKSYLEQALEQAEQKIEKGDFRKGLGKLDDACWNVSATDSVEAFDRIRGLAERVGERTEGRLAEKARALVDLTEERRTAYLERPPKTAILLAPRDLGEGMRTALYVLWLIGVAVVGFVLWVIYAGLALGGVVQRCSGIPGWYVGGGQVSGGSLLTAAVVGGSLWLAAGIAAWRLRRKLGLLFGGFVAVYVIGLVVLWFVSPLLWGPRHC